MKYQHQTKRRTGRPLSFDRSQALERAMHVFWRSGYETSSIADLTHAMGITPPSLYTAFGSKERLFLEAVRLYAGDPSDLERFLDEVETSLDGARALLDASAEAYTGELTPAGCMLASATASGSEASAAVQEAVADVRRDLLRLLEQRIGRDIAAGYLPPEASAVALAGLVMAVLQGMSVLARDGVPRATLKRIADVALDAWPEGIGQADHGPGQ